jgi:uncharacterized integral membrane protein
VSTEPQPTQIPAPDPAAQLNGPAAGTQPVTQQIPQQPAGQPPAAQPGPVKPGPQIKRTRISGMWFAIGFFALILLFLLIFILQNNHSVEISYLGAHGHLPLGVALLLAAVCGVLLTVLAGTARILQLRTVARRHRRVDARRATAAAAAPAAASVPSVPADPGVAAPPN